MKKITLLLFLFVSTAFYSQSNGITYQAVIYNPSGDIIPGVNNTNAPMQNKNICLQFSIIDARSQTEYQETIATTTDDFGMVNLVIGSGKQNGGYASSFATIYWSVDVKSLKVALDISGQCANFVEISNQKFETTPFAFAAKSAENVTGVVPIENGGTNAITVLGAKTNLALQNVDNTTDLKKPISTATQTALNLKEDLANKSVNLILDGASDVKYPSAKAVKTYVDANSSSGIAVIAAEIVRVSNAQAALATNLNTEISRATGAESTKEDLSNKSSSILVDANSDVKYPTVKAVKSYIDANSSTSSNGLPTEVSRATAAENTIAANLAAETVRATTAEGTLITNLAAEVTRAAAAEATKEILVNKSVNVTADGGSDTKYPSVKSVKTYVDGVASTNTNALTIEINRASTTEGTLNTNLGAEITRATTAEGTLTTNLASEVATRVAAVTGLTNNLATEVTRATTAEGTLTTNLAAEVTRATAAEGVNATAISSEAAARATSDTALATSVTNEASRATTAEGTLTTNLATEASTRGAAVTGLINNLATEVTRATTAEGTLTTNLAAEVTRATTAEAASELLINKSTSVAVDGGLDTKYPTVKSVKTYVDASTLAASTALNIEISRATTAEGTLTTNLGAETSRATTVEGTLTTNLLTEVSTRGAADLVLTNNVSTLTNGLSTEVTNRTNADLLKEDLLNKSVNVTTDGGSDTKYPTVKSVKTYVDANVNTINNNVSALNTLADGKIYVGDATSQAIEVALSGDATMSNSGVVTIGAAAVTSGKIADANVTTAKLADLNVTTGKIADAAITTVKLADANVTTDKIANNNVTNAKLQNSSVTINGTAVSLGGTVTITASPVGTALINGNVLVGSASNLAESVAMSGDVTIDNTGATSISTSKVTTTKIADANITTSKIADLAVTTAKIADANVTTAKILDLNVTTDKIANSNVTNAKLDKANIPLSGFGAALADISLGSQKLTNVANPVSAQDAATKNYVDTSVTATNNNVTALSTLADGKIYVGDATSQAIEVALSGDATMNNSGVLTIGTAAVTSAKIADSNITTTKIANLNVTTGKIADAAITTAKLADANVNTDKLADIAVTTAKIADANVTTAKLADLNVTTGKIADAAITTVKLADANVTTDKIANNNVTNAKLQNSSVTINGTAVSLGGTVTITASPVGTALITGNVLVGSASNVAASVAMSGDVTIDNTGATLIGTSKVTTTKIADTSVTDIKLDKANIPLSGFGPAAADVALGNKKLTGVADPTNAQDAATKAYVDTNVGALNTLADGKVYVGNASNQATEVLVSGDATMSNLGVVTIGTSKITTDKIANDNVTTAKIADLNVTTAKLAANSVTNDKLSNSSLTINGTAVSLGGTATITASPVGTALTSGNVLVGSSTNVAAAVAMSGDVTIDNAGATTIGTSKVTTAKILNDAVTTAKILDSNVTTAKIANDAVTTDKIADLNVTNAKLQNSSVTINGTAVSLGGTATITASPVGTSLTSGKVLVGSASNVAAAVAMSGDVTIDNTGATLIGTSKVTTTKIADTSVTDIKLDKANIPLSGFGPAAADVALGNKKLTGVANPTNAQDAATKAYVDITSAALNTEISRATAAENLAAENLIVEATRATDAENSKENTANKSTDVTMASNSDIKFPTQKAVRAYVASNSSVTSIRSISNNYTVVMSDHTILCDNTNGAFTLTLPNVVTSIGKMFVICKVDDTNNLLTFSPPLRYSFATSISTLNYPKAFQVQSDGTTWFIIN